MKKLNRFLLFFFVLSVSFLLYVDEVMAATGSISGNGVRFRSTAKVDNTNIIQELKLGNIVTLVSDTLYTGSGCAAGWYNVKYNDKIGYVCSSYVSFGTTTNTSSDKYGRPWTSPKKAIEGGAVFIAKSYISQGQFTSYLKKFNINPGSSYSLYNHQYMANLAAPSSEAKMSYNAYSKNGLLSLPLEFTIPIFNNMPDSTPLPGTSANTSCQAEVTDANFETALNEQGFPESYKCKLRILHNTYTNWTFKSLNTGLDFNDSVWREQKVSSIQGGSQYYYKDADGKPYQTEKGWYKANTETVAYYLDPRNFLNVERILMFENLGYSTNYTESVVQSVLNGTFMEGFSILDNQSYASIFVEAGRKAKMSSVYLASLAKQESGNKGSLATTGAQFTYKDKQYGGLYNFFNIGAYSSESSPILAGLVWASVGTDGGTTISTVTNEEEGSYLETLNVKNESGIMTNVSISTKASYFKIDYNNVTITVKDVKGNVVTGDTVVGTGGTVTIVDSNNTFTYTLSVSGDIDGDGLMSASDYVKIKSNIMGNNGALNKAQSLAADADGNGKVGASDYVLIKNTIMR